MEKPVYKKINMESAISHDEVISAEELESQDFRELIQPIFRYRRMVVLTIVLVVLSVFAYTMLTRPVYQSTALLEINKNRENSMMSLDTLFSSNLSMGMEEDLYNEAEIIKSRSVLIESIKQNGGQLVLDKSRPIFLHLINKISVMIGRLFKEKAIRSKNIDLEPLQVSLVKAENIEGLIEYEIDLIGKDSIEIKDNDEIIASGRLKQPIKTPFFTFVVSGGLPSEIGRTYRLTLTPMEEAIRKLTENLEIDAVRNTRLVKIKMNSINPDSAPKNLQGLIAAYQHFKIQRKTGTATKALEFINEQLKTVARQMQLAVGALEQFKEKENVLFLAENVRMVTEKITDLEKSKNELNMLRAQAALLYKNVETEKPLDKDSLFALGSVLEQPLLIRLADDLSKIQTEVAAFRSKYTEQHPQVQAMYEKVNNLKEKIKAESLSLISSLDSRLDVLDQGIKEAEKNLKGFPDLERRMADLTRQAKVSEETYSFLLEKKGELEVTRAGQIDDSWLVVPPYVLPEIIKPEIIKNMAAAMVFGFFLAVGLAFIRSYLDNTVKNGKDVTALTNLPVLGSIAGHSNSQNGNGSRYYLISDDEPNSHVAESFRTIRTNLLFTGIDKGKKTIICTSGMNSEGKTTVSTNVALSLSQTKKRVVLVDADLRKPMVHRSLNLKRQPGLTNVLIEEDWKTALSETIQKVENANLNVLVCGEVPPNPNEMLSSEKMELIINYLKTEYDYVIIDTPPTLIVSDALVLSKLVDGILIVARSNSTDRNCLKSSVKMIKQANGKILGAIINDVDFKKEQYYYKQYGKYYYR